MVTHLERKLRKWRAVKCAQKVRMFACSRGSGAIHWLAVCGMLFGGAGAVALVVTDEAKPIAATLACRLQQLGGGGEVCGVRDRSPHESDHASWLLERDALPSDVTSLPNLTASPRSGDADKVHMGMPPGAVVAAGVVAGVSAFAPNAGEPKPTTTKPSGGSGSGYRWGGFRMQVPKPGPFSWWRLSPAAVVLAVVNQYGLVGDVTPLQSIETEHGPVALAYNQPGFGGECLSIDGLKACRHAPLPFAEEDVEIRTPDGTLLATRQGDELLLEPDALTARAKQAQRWSFTSIVNRLRGIEDTTTNRPLELPNRVVFWSLSNDGTEVRMTLREDGTLHQEVWHNGREAPHLIRRVVWIPANRCGDACKQAPTNERGEVQYVCDPEGRCTAVVCFAEGTPVQTPSGRQPIETLQPGDLVLAKDPETGRTEWKAVARTFETPNRPLRRLVLRRELSGTVWFDELEATAEHPFYVPDVGWRPVSALEVGVRVATQNGHATVVENTSLGGKHTVFNLEVEDFHTYFVGELDAWVHNQCGPDDPNEINRHGEREVWLGDGSRVYRDGNTLVRIFGRHGDDPQALANAVLETNRRMREYDPGLGQMIPRLNREGITDKGDVAVSSRLLWPEGSVEWGELDPESQRRFREHHLPRLLRDGFRASGADLNGVITASNGTVLQFDVDPMIDDGLVRFEPGTGRPLWVAGSLIGALPFPAAQASQHNLFRLNDGTEIAYVRVGTSDDQGVGLIGSFEAEVRAFDSAAELRAVKRVTEILSSAGGFLEGKVPPVAPFSGSGAEGEILALNTQLRTRDESIRGDRLTAGPTDAPQRRDWNKRQLVRAAMVALRDQEGIVLDEDQGLIEVGDVILRLATEDDRFFQTTPTGFIWEWRQPVQIVRPHEIDSGPETPPDPPQVAAEATSTEPDPKDAVLHGVQPPDPPGDGSVIERLPDGTEYRAFHVAGDLKAAAVLANAVLHAQNRLSFAMADQRAAIPPLEKSERGEHEVKRNPRQLGATRTWAEHVRKAGDTYSLDAADRFGDRLKEKAAALFHPDENGVFRTDEGVELQVVWNVDELAVDVRGVPVEYPYPIRVVRAGTSPPEDDEPGGGQDYDGLSPASAPFTEVEYQAMLDSEEIRNALSDEERRLLRELAPDDYVAFDWTDAHGSRREDTLPLTTTEFLRTAATVQHEGELRENVTALVHPRHDEDPDPRDPPEPMGDQLPPALRGGHPDDWGRYLSEGSDHYVFEYAGWVYRVLKPILGDGGLATPRQRAALARLAVRANRRMRRDPELRGIIPKLTEVGPGVVRLRFLGDLEAGQSRPADRGEAEDILRDATEHRVRRLMPLLKLADEREDIRVGYDGVPDNAAFDGDPETGYSVTDWFDSTTARTAPRRSGHVKYAVGLQPLTRAKSGQTELAGWEPLLTRAERRALLGWATPPERNFWDANHAPAVQQVVRSVMEEKLIRERGRFALQDSVLQPPSVILNLTALAAGLHDLGPRTPGGKPITSETIKWFQGWIQTEQGKDVLGSAVGQDMDQLSMQDVQTIHDFMEVIIASTDKASPRSLIEPPLARLIENAGPETAKLALETGTDVALIELSNSALVDPTDRAFLRLLGRDEQMRVDGELEKSALDTTDSYYHDHIFPEETPGGSRFDVDDPRPAARIRIAEDFGIAEDFTTISESDIESAMPRSRSIPRSRSRTRSPSLGDLDDDDEWEYDRYDINRRMYRIVAEIRSKAPDTSRDKLWTETRRRLIEEFPAVSELPEYLF